MTPTRAKMMQKATALLTGSLALGACSQKLQLTNHGGDDAGGLDPGLDIGNLDAGFDGAAQPAACAEQRFEAIPGLDLFLVVDDSSSMGEALAGGAAGMTKWTSMRDALTAFVMDARSAGLGVGIQYFPVKSLQGNATCTNEAACGGVGPCNLLRICTGFRGTLQCKGPTDCPAGSKCVVAGQCSTEKKQNAICEDVGAPCVNSLGVAGTCDVAYGMCENYFNPDVVCDVKAYAKPAVGIATLPVAAPPLVASLADAQALGNTPMGVAVSESLRYMRTKEVSDRNRRSVMVLATDGIPDVACEPQDVAGIAHILNASFKQTPSIATYVIGVASDADVGKVKPAVELLALNGGTSNPIMVTPAQDLTAALLAAFGQIREAALPCEYDIPLHGQGQVDFGKVNLSYSPPGAPVVVVGYVGDAGSCRAEAGGWYYDIDPATGATPTRIEVCAATCKAFKSGAGGKVEILYGCKTKLIE